jgi:hypothetical protein
LRASISLLMLLLAVSPLEPALLRELRYATSLRDLQAPSKPGRLSALMEYHDDCAPLR